MKVLIVTGIFPPEVGGPATFAGELGTRLVALGHIVQIVTYSEAAASASDEHFPFQVKRIVRKGKFSNYVRFFFWLVFHMRAYEAVLGLDWFSAGVPLWLASMATGRRYSMRVGGGYIWEKYLSQGEPPVSLVDFYEKGLYRRYRLMHMLIKRVLGQASLVVFNTLVQSRLYAGYYSIQSRRIRVLENPVEPIEIGISRTAPTKEIVFAGRLIIMKNVASLIRAFAALKDSSYRLLVIGEGPEESALRALAEELKLGDRISWSPALSRTELYKRIINCAYVVIPSWTDISPNQAAECLALGIPFLITKNNYLSFIPPADSTESVLTIDPARVDDIAAKMNLLADPVAYGQFVAGLRSLSFSYGWNRAAADWADLLSGKRSRVAESGVEF